MAKGKRPARPRRATGFNLELITRYHKEEHFAAVSLVCELRIRPVLGTALVQDCTGTRRFPSVPKLAKASQSLAAPDLGVCRESFAPVIPSSRLADAELAIRGLPGHRADRNNLRTGPAIHFGLVLPVIAHGDICRRGSLSTIFTPVPQRLIKQPPRDL